MMMQYLKEKLFFLVLFILMSYCPKAQDLGPVEGVDARHFQIISEGDTIDFLKLNPSVQFRRPVLIFLQGSLPIPLVIEGEREVKFKTSFPFDISKYTRHYHVINISMPKLPLEVSGEEIKTNGVMKSPPRAYNRENFLQNYRKRGLAVLDFLKEQNWVDTSQVMVFGHSQGSYVATELARHSDMITHLGLSGFNPFGRIEGQIRDLRIKEHAGLLMAKEAQNKINELYERWQYIVAHKDVDDQPRGDTPKATFSFSKDFLPDLLAIDQPMFIIYGSQDRGALGCDYLPVIFEREGKKITR